MEIYERIKQRRKELDLSADVVAEALGVSRATIYRYESADIEKLPITIVEPLAKVLHLTPAALMGWEDEAPAPSDNKSLRDEFTPHEKDVIYSYRDSDVFVQQAVDALLKIQDELEKKERLA